MFDKKAQLSDRNIGTGILTVIIVASILVAFVTIFLDGLNEFTPADACSDALCAFDNPAGFCAINSSAEGAGISCPNPVRESLPLQALFVTVLAIIFAVGIFLAIMKSVRKV